MTNHAGTHNGPPTDASLGELVEQLSEQTSRLAHRRSSSPRPSVVEDKRIETGLAMFGGAGAIGLYALGALVAATVLGLAIAVTAWLSALIIAVVLGVIAGLLALRASPKSE